MSWHRREHKRLESSRAEVWVMGKLGSGSIGWECRTWNTWNTVLTKNSMPSSRPCGKAVWTGGSQLHGNGLPIDETVGNCAEAASDILPQIHPILADDRSEEHTSELPSLM